MKSATKILENLWWAMTGAKCFSRWHLPCCRAATDRYQKLWKCCFHVSGKSRSYITWQTGQSFWQLYGWATAKQSFWQLYGWATAKGKAFLQAHLPWHALLHRHLWLTVTLKMLWKYNDTGNHSIVQLPNHFIRKNTVRQTVHTMCCLPRGQGRPVRALCDA